VQQQGDHASQWAAIGSVAAKIGSAAEPLREAERNSGQRAGATSDDPERLRALERELTPCLRTGRAPRVQRSRAGGRGKSFVIAEILISERPAEAEYRAGPGHWEGVLIIGLDRSASGTLVARTTRFTMLLHLPPIEGRLTGPRGTNGPALAGHGAAGVRDAITCTITTLE
jgi:hypothetical protein